MKERVSASVCQARAWHAAVRFPRGSFEGRPRIRMLRPALSTKQPLQLLHVQPVLAYDGPVEKQHGDVQAVAAQELRVAIDIDNGYGG
jgi:hypothetical protein